MRSFIGVNWNETISSVPTAVFISGFAPINDLTAIRLYEKLGFRAIGVRKNYYQGEKEDALVMTKELLPGLAQGPRIDCF